MRIECKDEDELKRLKTRATKCKVIALHKAGKHPLYDPRKMITSERKGLLEKIEEWFQKDDAEIDLVFNEISCEILFAGDADIDTYRRENPHCEDIHIKKDDPDFPSVAEVPEGGWKDDDWKTKPILKREEPPDWKDMPPIL